MGNKGFTLVEVLITLVIFTMLIVVVANVYITGTVSSKEEIKVAQIQADGKNALEGIKSNVMLGSSVETAYSGYISDNTSVILKVPAIDSSENFLYSGGQKLYDYIIYHLYNKELQKIVYSGNVDSRLYNQNGNVSTLLDNVKSLSFTYDVAPPQSKSVTIDITLEDTSTSEMIEIMLSETTRMRN